MDQQPSFRSILVGWLKEIVPYNRLDTYVKKTREGFETNPQPTDRRANHVTYLLVTARHSYSISATPTYLGCIASATFYRPGENWTRGNDLPDGKFTRETWEHIKNAIIRYELLKLEPEHTAVIDLPRAVLQPETPEEVELREADHNLYRANCRLTAARRAVTGANRNEPDEPATRYTAEVAAE